MKMMDYIKGDGIRGVTSSNKEWLQESPTPHTGNYLTILCCSSSR